MLRNTGVNVTEHKIRQDVHKAYEYDYLRECSRYGRRRDQEARYMGYKTHIRRQPRYHYSTIPRHFPSYYHSARSSILSYTRYPELDRVYGVKRIYLPERDSGESSYFIRKPSYREKYYSNQKPYHIAEVERPLRRDFRFNPESPRRSSSMYLDENRIERLMDATRCIIENYCPKRNSSKYKKPVRKITKKMSPMRDCTTPLSVRPSKRTSTSKLNSPIRTHQKAKCSNLSKEAKILSQDIFDILTLLQKAEAEEEEQYSSDSVLQHVHSFNCSSTNNITRRKTDLITERVQIYPKMDKKRQEPLAKLKNITGVRSKLEELVNILKQYEYNSGSKADILPKNENPPSPEDVKSCNDETKEYQGRKNIELQTEEPKTSNKSICGRTMKNNSIEVIKSLKARFSSKVKEKINTKKRNESDKQKMVKQDEGKKMLNYKKTSKDEKLRENETSKQNLADNCYGMKTGLMITIGGKVLRKKPAVFQEEKRLDKMSKTWIKKYLDTKKNNKDNNIHQRWNNRAFYNHSSTTVVEVINNVYKQMGINLKSKYYDVSRKSRTPVKSPKKTRNRQTVQAYMMPQTVMHDHVYMSEDILIAKRQVTKSIRKLISNKKVPFEQNINLENKCSTYSNIFNLSNDPSSIFFRIYMPIDYFDTVSTSNQTLKISTSDERVYKVTEYEATKSDVLKNCFTGNGSLKGDKPAIVHNKEKNDVHVNHGASNLCFLPKCELQKKIISQIDVKNNTAKLEHQMQELVDDEASLNTPETSDVRAREKLTHSQNAKIQYLIASSNIQSTQNRKSEDTELQFIVGDKNTKTENFSTTVTEEFTEADHIKKFYPYRKENSMSDDQVILKIQSTNYSFQLENPLVHQMSFRSLQHLRRPQYLPQPSYSYPLATRHQRHKPQYPPQSQLVSLSKHSLKAQFIPSLSHDAAEIQYLVKFQTKLEPQHAYQTEYTPKAKPSFEPKNESRVQYLDRANIYYFTQISKFGNNKFSYSKSSTGTAEVQLKLKTGGGKIANIYISNDGHSARINDLKLIYQRKSQENLANNNAAKQIVKPTVQILKSSLKIHFSVESIKAKEFKISKNQIYHGSGKKICENVRDTYHITARSHSDSVAYKSIITNQNCPSFFHQISRHLHSKGTDPINKETRDNSVQPIHIAESTIRRINNTNKTSDPTVTNSSLENYDVIEKYVKKLLNETIKMNNNNLKRVAETKRMLHAIMIMNASGYANITSANEELINDLTTSVKTHLSMYKEIVKMFKKLRKNNKEANLLEQQIDANNDESDVVKSKTNTPSRVHNILAKTLTRCQKVDTKSNNYIKTKRDHTTSCCILNSGNYPMHQLYPAFSSMRSLLKRNAVVSTETLFGNRKYDSSSTSTSCREPRSKVQSSSKDKLYPKVKKTFSEWIKYVKKKTVRTNDKIKIQMKTEVRDATTSSSAYLLIEPYRSQEKLYIVVVNDTLQNKNPVKIDDESEILNYDPINDILHNVTIPADILQSDTVKKLKILNNVTNPAKILQSHTVEKAKILNNITNTADILQSDKVKKAVLRIYTEDSKKHKDSMVAKLPKFLSL